ncbi:hypothetical protein IPM62_01325 [Candidatus Woesebacteria bacterium]|nr:MAG: hypothetical protein IPM62_01325 [Candidatus Woesebacteria bacterium]
MNDNTNDQNSTPSDPMSQGMGGVAPAATDDLGRVDSPTTVTEMATSEEPPVSDEPQVAAESGEDMVSATQSTTAPEPLANTQSDTLSDMPVVEQVAPMGVTHDDSDMGGDSTPPVASGM